MSNLADIAIPPQMDEALGMIKRIGGVALVHKLTGLFRDTAVARIPKLDDAAVHGNGAELKRLAHAMKGSAAQMGAEPLRACAHALEVDAPTLAADQMPQRVRELAVALDEAVAQLNCFLKREGGDV